MGMLRIADFYKAMIVIFNEWRKKAIIFLTYVIFVRTSDSNM